MNYDDSILENKYFGFFKQLMYNIALAACGILLIALVLVWGFKFQLYNVLSPSEEPYFTTGDMVVVRQHKEYKVGDIIKFTHFSQDFPVTHRLVGIVENGGKTYYICHGDAVSTSNPYQNGKVVNWQTEANFIKSLTYAQIMGDETIATPSGTGTELKISSALIQIVEKDKIDGKVVCWFANYGDYLTFIKDHKLLLIALVVSVWCISGVIQNELEMKKSKRLEA